MEKIKKISAFNEVTHKVNELVKAVNYLKTERGETPKTEITEGDIVVLLDMSYIRGIKEDEFVEYCDGYKEKHVVVKTDFKTDSFNFRGDRHEENDTIIRHCKTGDILFVKKKFLKPIPKREYC